MFSKTYRATLKTLFRSPLFWAALALLFGVCIYQTFFQRNCYYDLNLNESIWEGDPRYVLDYRTYDQNLRWTTLNKLMFYVGPLFYVITAGIVLVHDWRDNFFEIERAGGVRPSSYFLGRFTAIFTVGVVSSLLFVLIAFHGKVIFMWNGLPGYSPWEYFIDSNTRLLRLFFIAVVPGILIFTGVTFLAGNLAKSGTVGLIGGTVYVLLEYLANGILNLRMPAFYFKYLTPHCVGLYQYWECYDTEFFEIKFPHNPFSTEEMLVSLGILVAAGLALAAASYFLVRRRKV